MYRVIPYQPLLNWLLLSSMLLFMLLLSWDLGVLSLIIGQDRTHITLGILLLLIAGVIHGGYRSWRISREYLYFEAYRSHPERLPEHACALHYLNSLKGEMRENPLSAEMLSERLRGGHQVGWFLSGVLIKLGLLGTVVGFILMLSSVSGLENLDTSDIKALMQKMTEGMGIAMNTTLVGLIGSMLLGGQYLMLDRSADRLVLEVVSLGQRLRGS